MVTSIQAVPMVGKMRREEEHYMRSQPDKQTSHSLFGQVLEQAIEENESTPLYCQTTTYGPDSKIQRFQYLSKEYTY